MIEWPDTGEETNLGLIHNVSEEERNAHARFVLRHIDFISEILAAEPYTNQWKKPSVCVDAIPDQSAHDRGAGGYYPCVTERIETFERDFSDGKGDRTTSIVSTDASKTATCPCDDPLVGSDDPLDHVVAVILASNDSSIINRYFEHHWRNIAAELRETYGTWDDVLETDIEDLHSSTVTFDVFGKNGVALHRLERLQNALKELREHRYLDDLEYITLTELPRLSYEYTVEMLTSLPGISERDAWWLLLTAFDSPVWPANSKIDTLLAELGMIEPSEVNTKIRHEKVKNQLTPRQVLDLHRGLATHAHYNDSSPCSEDCSFRKFLLTYRILEQKRDTEKPVIVDLFAGAGGLSYGFKRADFDIAFAIDNDEHAVDTYRLNHPEVPHQHIISYNIEEVTTNHPIIQKTADNIDVVVGGPPCQAFSRAGYRASRSSEGFSILDDPRADLYTHYVDLITEIQPKLLLMENVTGILTELDGADSEEEIRVINLVLDSLEDAGYQTDFRRLDCSDFDIPQTRERIVILGVHEDYARTALPGPDLLLNAIEQRTTPDKEIDLAQALSNLARLRRAEGADVTVNGSSGKHSDYVDRYDLAQGINIVPNHRTREHPMEKDRKIFEDVMEPGDTGWTVKYEKNRPDLIDYPVGTEDDPTFDDKYRMLYWDRPCPTIMAHLRKDSNDFVIPDFYEYVQKCPEKQDKRRSRGITPREAARVQSFPDHYIFLGPFTAQFQQIGNAVPPVLGEHIGKVIDDWLTQSVASEEAQAPESRVVEADD